MLLASPIAEESGLHLLPEKVSWASTHCHYGGPSRGISCWVLVLWSSVRSERKTGSARKPVFWTYVNTPCLAVSMIILLLKIISSLCWKILSAVASPYWTQTDQATPSVEVHHLSHRQQPSTDCFVRIAGLFASHGLAGGFSGNNISMSIGFMVFLRLSAATFRISVAELMGRSQRNGSFVFQSACMICIILEIVQWKVTFTNLQYICVDPSWWQAAPVKLQLCAVQYQVCSLKHIIWHNFKEMMFSNSVCKQLGSYSALLDNVLTNEKI